MFKYRNLKLSHVHLTRKHKLILVFALAGAVIFSALIFTAVVALEIKTQAYTFKDHASQAYAAVKNQDLAGTKAALDTLSTDINAISLNYGKLSFWRLSPLYWHYQDGLAALKATAIAVDIGHLAVDTLEPYADVIGFKGQGSFIGGTAEDRIVKIMETLDVIAPTLDEMIAKIDLMSTYLNQINPQRYPFQINQQSTAALINQLKTSLSQVATTLADYKPLIEKLPEIAGVKEPKRYLILFQNDAELRPTGGFWTAYALLKVDKGKVTPERSDDIYDLDNKFRLNLQPPEIFQRHLNVTTWHLRDMNLSPDFYQALQLFMPYYLDLPGESAVDGVIAIDTKVLTDLVSVIGEIDVPGFGRFSTETDPRCNCPQLIYELEDIVGRPTPYLRSDRKAILGPMMQTILHRAYGAPKQIWPALFQSIWTNINQKDVLFYFIDPASQAAVERVNLAGRIKPFIGDYLHINNTNLGGAKSNLFVSYEVDQEISQVDGQYQKTVTATYKNPFKSSNCNLEAGQLCLNGVLPNWVRFYLPLGSELVSSQGFEADSVKTSTDLDKTVIEGFFKLNPEAQIKVSITYRLPIPIGAYQLLIQKQPGIHLVKSTVRFQDEVKTFDLVSDQLISFP